MNAAAATAAPVASVTPPLPVLLPPVEELDGFPPVSAPPVPPWSSADPLFASSPLLLVLLVVLALGL